MSKRHRQAQDLAEKVYVAARKQALRSVGRAIEKLDALYAKDAERLKTELGRLFRLSGIPERRVGKLIDEVFSKSRSDRVKVVEESITEAAHAARGVDEATFKAVFGGERAEAGPLARGRSGSRPNGPPSLRLVEESEDESA